MIEGTIEELIYLGDHIRTRLSVCGHDDFIVKVPNKGDAALAKGSVVKVGWKADDCRALDDPGCSEMSLAGAGAVGGAWRSAVLLWTPGAAVPGAGAAGRSGARARHRLLVQRRCQ